jgi:hypothetical protein
MQEPESREEKTVVDATISSSGSGHGEIRELARRSGDGSDHEQHVVGLAA